MRVTIAEAVPPKTMEECSARRVAVPSKEVECGSGNIMVKLLVSIVREAGLGEGEPPHRREQSSGSTASSI